MAKPCWMRKVGLVLDFLAFHACRHADRTMADTEGVDHNGHRLILFFDMNAQLFVGRQSDSSHFAAEVRNMETH